MWETLGGSNGDCKCKPGYHWNGIKWERDPLWDMGVSGYDNGGVTKIWGSVFDNLYFVGRKGSNVHYNDSTWRHHLYTEDVPYFWGKYRSLDVTENMVVAVGWLEDRAVVLRGYRMN
jgi:hypothetical protein